MHLRDLGARDSSQRATARRVRLVALHAQRQRLDAAQHQEAVDRRGGCRPWRSGGRRAGRAARRRWPITAPPTTSEWPFRYLVVECTTRSAPSSSGRWKYGRHEGVVDGQATRRAAGTIAATAAMSASAAAGWSASRPSTSRVFGSIAAATAAGVARVDVGEARARAAEDLVEQAEGAAVEVVAGDDVIARVEQCAARAVVAATPAANAKPSVAALERRQVRLEREAGRVVRARVLEALVLARARLRVGRGQEDRRHHRAGGRIGRLAGVDRAAVSKRGGLGFPPPRARFMRAARPGTR